MASTCKVGLLRHHAHVVPNLPQLPRHLPSLRARHVVRNAQQPDDSPDYSTEAFLKSFRDSNLISSEVYINELEGLQKKQDIIAGLLGKFWSMDVAGKRMFVDLLEDFLTTYSIHLGRLRLMKDDPAASKMLGLLNRQLIAAQVDVDTFYSSLSQQAEQFRELTDMEERALANPEEHARVRQYIQNLCAPKNVVDLRQILNDHPHLAEAFTDPQAMVLVKALADDPAAASNWVDHPKLGGLARVIVEYMRGR